MVAELLLTNGPIYTMDARQPRARHLAIGGGKILAIDNKTLDELRGPRTRQVDLGGRAVLPGFVDAHVHFASFALSRVEVNLDTATTLEQGIHAVQAACERLPRGEWVRGRGWDRNRWGRLPSALELDGATGHRPAVLSSHDGHALWLNSAALRAVGVDWSTADPAGGVIERDPSGAPTGVLFENAQDLVRDRIPEPTDDEVREAIRRTLPLAAAAGLTGIHNLEDSRSRRAFKALERSGELTLRVYHGVARAELKNATELGLRTGAGDDLFRIGPVKLFADGALGSRTAHLLEPYEGRTDDYRGVPTMTPDELCEAMRLAADAQLDLAVHAIGDAAVHSVLDTYESTRLEYPSLTERMLRIEHAQLVDPHDINRFAQLGVIASMQPIHASSDWQTADRHWGPRAKHGYAWRAVLDAGAVLAFGTDAPVERIEPLLSLHAATARSWYPEQRLTLEEAVRAYTVGSAIAERASDRRGRLVEGMDADLVVLSRDPFAMEPEALLETRIDLTMVGGHMTYGE